jgi:hypothetical protein
MPRLQFFYHSRLAFAHEPGTRGIDAVRADPAYGAPAAKTPMNIRQATTEMGTFSYLAEDFFIAAALDNGLAWERDVLRRTLA